MPGTEGLGSIFGASLRTSRYRKTSKRIGRFRWEAMAKVRAEKGADYVLMPDGSHPNAECRKLLADTIWPELKRLTAATLKEVEEKR